MHLHGLHVRHQSCQRKLCLQKQVMILVEQEGRSSGRLSCFGVRPPNRSSFTQRTRTLRLYDMNVRSTFAMVTSGWHLELSLTGE